MKLTEIITLASQPVQPLFNAMERSLRATGCTLPLRVIPFDDKKFELPHNASFLEDPELFDFLKGSAHPTLRKYLCLLRSNYLFVDTDVVFLQNPEDFFEPFEGFVLSCTHWQDPHHTTTAESLAYLRSRSTTFAKTLFNSGQFASDRALYTLPSLKAAAMTLPQTCLNFPYHEQPALNYLVHYSNVPICSLTLPPYNFESSWAGDYLNCNEIALNDKSPCFLHWAGLNLASHAPVNGLFKLTPSEKAAVISSHRNKRPTLWDRLRAFARGVKNSFKTSFCQ